MPPPRDPARAARPPASLADRASDVLASVVTPCALALAVGANAYAAASSHGLARAGWLVVAGLWLANLARVARRAHVLAARDRQRLCADLDHARRENTVLWMASDGATVDRVSAVLRARREGSA